MKNIKKFFADETGLEMSEYAVAAAIIIVAGAAVWSAVGTQIKAKMNELVVAMGGTAVP